MSRDYYTRLEQGRVPGASASTLEAIAHALQLSPDQTTYLFTLANKEAVTKTAGVPLVHPHTQRMLDNLVDTPALVMDRTMAILAWNSLAAAFYTDFAALSRSERNLLRLTFLDPDVRKLYVDWESDARAGVAFLRMDAAQSPTDPALQALVGELSVRDENFRQWWASHDVAHKTFGTKRYRHPVAGDLTVDWQILSCADNADQFLLIMTAEPGTPSHQGLRFLASLLGDDAARRSCGSRFPRSGARSATALDPQTRPSWEWGDRNCPWITRPQRCQRGFRHSPSALNACRRACGAGYPMSIIREGNG